jgi:hypothetical protein
MHELCRKHGYSLAICSECTDTLSGVEAQSQALHIPAPLLRMAFNHGSPITFLSEHFPNATREQLEQAFLEQTLNTSFTELYVPQPAAKRAPIEIMRGAFPGIPDNVLIDMMHITDVEQLDNMIKGALKEQDEAKKY